MLVPKGAAYQAVVKEAARRERMDRLGGTRGTDATVIRHTLGSRDKLGRKLERVFTDLNRRYS